MRLEKICTHCNANDFEFICKSYEYIIARESD